MQWMYQEEYKIGQMIFNRMVKKKSMIPFISAGKGLKISDSSATYMACMTTAVQFEPSSSTIVITTSQSVRPRREPYLCWFPRWWSRPLSSWLPWEAPCGRHAWVLAGGQSWGCLRGRWWGASAGQGPNGSGAAAAPGPPSSRSCSTAHTETSTRTDLQYMLSISI